jgi:hypothetical protein
MNCRRWWQDLLETKRRRADLYIHFRFQSVIKLFHCSFQSVIKLRWILPIPLSVTLPLKQGPHYSTKTETERKFHVFRKITEIYFLHFLKRLSEPRRQSKRDVIVGNKMADFIAKYTFLKTHFFSLSVLHLFVVDTGCFFCGRSNFFYRHYTVQC